MAMNCKTPEELVELAKNSGIERGCGAGRDHFCIRADGQLSPCIYIEEPENFDLLADYWEKSAALQKLRSIDKNTAESCKDCCYKRFCLPCYYFKA